MWFWHCCLYCSLSLFIVHCPCKRAMLLQYCMCTGSQTVAELLLCLISWFHLCKFDWFEVPLWTPRVYFHLCLQQCFLIGSLNIICNTLDVHCIVQAITPGVFKNMKEKFNQLLKNSMIKCFKQEQERYQSQQVHQISLHSIHTAAFEQHPHCCIHTAAFIP